MQTEALGWSIDDILLTTTVSPHDPRHLAISCKSNVQVSGIGTPTEVGQQWAVELGLSQDELLDRLVKHLEASGNK